MVRNHSLYMKPDSQKYSPCSPQERRRIQVVDFVESEDGTVRATPGRIDNITTPNTAVEEGQLLSNLSMRGKQNIVKRTMGPKKIACIETAS